MTTDENSRVVSPKLRLANWGRSRSVSRTGTSPNRGSRSANARRRFLVVVTQVVLIVAFLGIWQFSSSIDEFYFSRPSEIYRSVVAWQDQGVLLSSIWLTFWTTILGFVVGGLLGFLVGFLLGSSDIASDVFGPIITTLNSIPRLALVPLFLMWFGLGVTPRVALVATLVFFLIFYNTYAGVRDVDRHLIDVLRLMSAKRHHIFGKVVLPSAATWVISGMRISVPYALVGAVTSEMLAANSGMGYLLQRSAGQFFTPGVFGAIAVMVIMAQVLMLSVTLFERRVLRWKIDGGTKL